MTMREAIKAVREACKRMEVRYTPSAGEYIYGSADALAAIAAAEAAANERVAKLEAEREELQGRIDRAMAKALDGITRILGGA